VLLVLLAKMGHKEEMERMANLGTLENLGMMESQEMMVCQVTKDFKDFRDPQGLQDQKVILVRLALVPLVSKVHPVFQEKMDLLPPTFPVIGLN